MRLTDVMETAVVTIAPTEKVERARQLMSEQSIRHLVVVDGGVQGVLSDRDVERRTEETTVAEVMSSPAVVLAPNATVKKAANVMRGQKIGCIVVMDGQKLKGIVSETDLLETLSKKGTSSKKRASVRARGNKRRR